MIGNIRLKHILNSRPHRQILSLGNLAHVLDHVHADPHLKASAAFPPKLGAVLYNVHPPGRCSRAMSLIVSCLNRCVVTHSRPFLAQFGSCGNHQSGFSIGVVSFAGLDICKSREHTYVCSVVNDPLK